MYRKHWPAINNTAVCFEKLGKMTACKKWLKRMVALKPTSWRSYSALNRCCLVLGEFQEAMTHIDLTCKLIMREFVWENIRVSFMRKFEKGLTDKEKR